MPIVLRHNATLELNRVEYSGAIVARDLHDHAAFNAANPEWLGFDCVSVLQADVDTSRISVASLDEVFRTHSALFTPLSLMFVRRSAWICESEIGQQLLNYWITKRNAMQRQWSDVRQFESFEAAGEWMLLSAESIATLKSGENFKQIAHFDATPGFAR